MAISGSSEFRFQSVVLKQPEKNIEVDFTGGTLELQINESIQVPYLTGRCIIADPESILEDLKLTGTELLCFEIVNDEYNLIYKKDFYITRTESKYKIGDQGGFSYIFYLTEDIFVLDVLNKISKAYSGTPDQIIKKVLSSEFDRKLVTYDTLPRNEAFTYVSPYVSPLTIIERIKTRATDQNGFPFFCYATLNNKDINFKCLSEMITNKPLNPYVDFKYTAGASGSGDAKDRVMAIEYYEKLGHNDTMEMILKGAVQSRYNVMNINTSKRNQNTQVNIAKQLNSEETSIYNKDFTIREKKVTEYDPQVLYRLVTHTNKEELGYHDETDIEAHVNKAKAFAAKQALSKHMVQLTVNGLPSWQAGVHFIGNQINISIPDSREGGTVSKENSGPHVVIDCRHSFVEEKYTQSMTASRLTYSAKRTSTITSDGFNNTVVGPF